MFSCFSNFLYWLIGEYFTQQIWFPVYAFLWNNVTEIDAQSPASYTICMDGCLNIRLYLYLQSLVWHRWLPTGSRQADLAHYIPSHKTGLFPSECCVTSPGFSGELIQRALKQWSNFPTRRICDNEGIWIFLWDYCNYS